MVGKLVRDRGDGTYDVQMQKVRVPPIDAIVRDGVRHFANITKYVAALEVHSQPLPVIGKIIGHINSGRSNYGLQLRMSGRRGDGSFL
jgi:hypothetical protein